MHLTYRLGWISRPQAPAAPPAPTAAHYRWLALGVIVLTIYGALIPLRYRPLPVAEALAAFREISYADPSLLDARGDWVASVVQFAALGFLVMAALCVDRRRAAGFVTAAVVGPGIIALGIALEFVQVFFPPRTVSLNDIGLESLGGVAGVLLWLLAGQRLAVWSRRIGSARQLPGLADRLLPAYLALLLVVHLMPFDLVIGGDELARKVREGKVCLIPFRGLAADGIGALASQATDAASFVPLGLLAALAPRWARRGRAAVLGLGLACTALVESLQLFVYSRYCDATDVITGTAAVLLGWQLARGLLGRGQAAREASRDGIVVGRGGAGLPRSIRVLLACGWFVALALASWQPFDCTTDPARFADADGLLSDEDTAVCGWRRMAWAPLADYYWGSKYNAADQFTQKAMSFAPLGVLMAIGPGRRGRPGAVGLVVLAALVAGATIEAGQYFIPQRHPSTTDLLIECMGAWLGFATARHIGWVCRAEGAGTRSYYEFGH